MQSTKVHLFIPTGVVQVYLAPGSYLDYLQIEAWTREIGEIDECDILMRVLVFARALIICAL